MVKKSLKANSRSNYSRKVNKRNRQNDKHRKTNAEIKSSDTYKRKLERRLNDHITHSATGGVKIEVDLMNDNDVDNEFASTSNRNVEQVKMSFQNQQLVRSMIHADDVKSQFDDNEQFTYSIISHSKKKTTTEIEESYEGVSNIELFTRLISYGFTRDHVLKAMELNDDHLLNCIVYLWQLIDDNVNTTSATTSVISEEENEMKRETVEEELLVLSSMFDTSKLTTSDDHSFISLQLDVENVQSEDSALSNEITYLHVYIPLNFAYPTTHSAIFLIKNDLLTSEEKYMLITEMKNESQSMLGCQMIYSLYSWLQHSIEDKLTELKERKKQNIREEERKQQQLQMEQKRQQQKQKKQQKQKQKQQQEREKRKSSVEELELTEEDLLRISEKMKTDFQIQQQSEPYQKMQKQRKRLPVYGSMDDILDAIDDNQVILICSETGSGKSTQIAQFILDDMITNSFGSECNIIVTQPRRISAVSLAERVSAERNEQVGNSVGYSIQLESKRSSNTRILFCTIGILLRLLENDPDASDISHIIIDEVHERSIDSDFLLIVVKQLIKRRSDVKIILMSATLQADLFSEYFNDCEVLEISGRTFPIQNYHLEDVIEFTGYTLSQSSPYAISTNKQQNKQKQKQSQQQEKQENGDQSKKIFDSKKYCERTVKSLSIFDEKQINYELIIELLKYIVKTESNQDKDYGSVLIFMPGLAEITKLYDLALLSFGDKSKYLLLPLHSSLTTVSQQKIFEKTKPGVRKIVISTNIAETSITIEDCTIVIDTGRAKQNQYSHQTRMASLVECWISKANAIQRSGRAGRVREGKCYRMYTKYRFETQFKEQQVPEIFRVSLESICLKIKSLRLNGSTLAETIGQALEPPNGAAITSAIQSLTQIGALSKSEELTPLGSHLSRLPIDVQLAKMIIYGAMLQCLDPVLTIAASMGNQSPFLSPFNEREEARRAQLKFRVEKSDHLTLLKVFHYWKLALREKKERTFCSVHYLSNQAFLQILQRKKQFIEELADIGFIHVNRWVNRSNLEEHQVNDHYNRNQFNLAMVKAALVAGLYPNLITVVEKDKDVKFLSPSGPVAIHPSSVLFQDNLFDNKYIVYLEKMKTSKVYIRDATMVTPYSLMLFGTNLNYDKDSSVLSIDRWIKFRVDKQIAILMDQLRIKLTSYLKKRIEQFSENDNDQGKMEEEEDQLVNAIAEILGTEHSIHNFEQFTDQPQQSTQQRKRS